MPRLVAIVDCTHVHHVAHYTHAMSCFCVECTRVVSCQPGNGCMGELQPIIICFSGRQSATPLDLVTLYQEREVHVGYSFLWSFLITLLHHLQTLLPTPLFRNLERDWLPLYIHNLPVKVELMDLLIVKTEIKED